MALYYCCCWQIASKKDQLPRCRWRGGMLVLGIFLSGSGLCFGNRSEGWGCGLLRWVPHTSASCPSCCQLATLPLGIPLQAVRAGGWRRGSEAICSHVTFPTSKLCFYNYWPRLPQEFWPAQRALFFHFCQQWVFAPAGRLCVSCLSSPATCCAGQAACHVLKRLLSTPLPCFARRANAP